MNNSASQDYKSHKKSFYKRKIFKNFNKLPYPQDDRFLRRKVGVMENKIKNITTITIVNAVKLIEGVKDVLMHAPPVTEGKGMSLLKKMGWNPGEGLGKNKEGSLEPLLLDIKTDKKGLVSEGENSKKGVSSFLKDLQGKHPVSALMELCSKRKWKPPLYTCVKDDGPPHKKLFVFKVEVNGIEYQPVNPCSNKKIAKADAAVLCLQSLNVLPKAT